ncbi:MULTISPECIES: GTP cyclohydrolase I [Pandoraea]|jgi:GTP cyclohydrolase I|uniref:GTP cyclohydrolase I n=1 Tax=Pandoraea pnomenusa TaxID=93220 RepID=A0A378YF44_9BURK|nr:MULTISPECIES: GTP cyclohydrolase I [Pandoraea]AHB74259.1 GTP cyclohydrolase [Pandoraea pnomenusa]AHN73169.1 GTP cyclohydrolase [Pandoraea pnomenusa]AIU26059.1 GTP cyclohydrolase [Pandoraea pnomenusa]ANC43309.1 GTP cyclohydrolase [Pandoraea pnomenusa]MBN9093083.1 GTP cyclohydrolase I [Pandoraea pnomenusa]
MGAVIDSQQAIAITQGPQEGIPLSQAIRQRLRGAGVRFHANDNIAAYLREGDVDRLQDEVTVHIENALRALVIDVDNDHNTRDTAKRVAKMFVKEVFAGRYEPPPAITEFPNIGQLNELTLIGPLRVRSACSHHLCPIMGHAWIGVLPNADSNLPGLSKYARLLNWVMARPQIQEEAVKQIADLLEEKIAPDGLAVVMEADHFCMHWRGTKDDGARMVSSVMRGRFLEDSALRREFLALMASRAR